MTRDEAIQEYGSMMRIRREYVIAKCEAALKTLESGIARARAEIKSEAPHYFGETELPEDSPRLGHGEANHLPEILLHELTWGFANASSDIEGAYRNAAEYVKNKEARDALIKYKEAV